MNANFKPLGLAAAVATATAGYAGYANAQAASYASTTELGDLAIVPYYTVMEGYATGVNIINTSEQTQVIKFRFRRATDSMDALDFNVVLSPKDMYTGFLSAAGDDITWTSNDNSCTAPDYNLGDNKFVMPGIYREDADTGYIEIISMGSPDSETSSIAAGALHDSDGIPADCAEVRDHFFNLVGEPHGVQDSVTTIGSMGDTVTYSASPDSLKVSYFIKSDETGVEFGDNAVHIAGFMDGASMTNQETGVFSGDLQGFDHPDLNGGAPQSVIDAVAGAATLARYNELRDVLSAEELINDWSANAAGDFSVDTDWVVTIPGQYVMLNLPIYLNSLVDETAPCLANVCDYRDIPMTAAITVYDREEGEIQVEDGELVVSPQPPVIIPTLELPSEVNVIQWGNAPVLNAPVAITGLDTPPGASFGWASLVATSRTDVTQQSICEYDGSVVNNFPAMDCTTAATGSAPLVGFVAWQRNFAALPAANYGRIVEHSRVQSS